jgi:hypothetical protein
MAEWREYPAIDVLEREIGGNAYFTDNLVLLTTLFPAGVPEAPSVPVKLLPIGVMVKNTFINVRTL